MTPEQVSRCRRPRAARFATGRGRSAGERAAFLERAADLLEAAAREVLALCVREGGKTIPDAVAECARRSITALLRARARAEFAHPLAARHRRASATSSSSTAAASSPASRPGIFRWRFSPARSPRRWRPATCVIAKPAEQTPTDRSACRALLHKAGVPREALHLLPGDRSDGRRTLVQRSAHRRRRLHRLDRHCARDQPRARGARTAPIVPADRRDRRPERDDRRFPPRCPSRWCVDVLISSFNSAGQRCTALRVLFVQEDIAEQADRDVGRRDGGAEGRRSQRCSRPMSARSSTPKPRRSSTAAHRAHEARGQADPRGAAAAPMPRTAISSRRARSGSSACSRLEREVFGPVLHVVRYAPTASTRCSRRSTRPATA